MSCRPSNMSASMMLRGGLSNTTLQYSGVSSMTRRCDADSVMTHAPGCPLNCLLGQPVTGDSDLQARMPEESAPPQSLPTLRTSLYVTRDGEALSCSS